MERTVAQGGVGGRTFTAGDLAFATAGRADEPDIRRLLRETATDGWIRLALAREPDAFAAAAVMGQRHAYVIARSRESGEAVGVCEWSARDAFVDGEVTSLSYLGALRIAPTHRHRIRVLRGGFEVVRQLLHGDAHSRDLASARAASTLGPLPLKGGGLGWGSTPSAPSGDSEVVSRALSRAPHALSPEPFSGDPHPDPPPFRGRERTESVAGSGAIGPSLRLRRGITPYALTAIAAENHTALRLLSANLPGMPTYRLLEPFSTFALRPVPAPRSAIRVERARADDLPAIAVCLERAYRQHQLAPVWSSRDLADRCPGLAPEDFLIVRRGPGVAACVALWDQSAFKQTVVCGYAPWIETLRPLANIAAPLIRMPRLPAPGEPLRQVYLSHLAVTGNDPLLFGALLDAGLGEARRRGFAIALTGLATRHPLAAELTRRYRHREYRALLHLVHWPDGAAAAAALTPRLPHVEIAVL